jgi:hypothetical protein
MFTFCDALSDGLQDLLILLRGTRDACLDEFELRCDRLSRVFHHYLVRIHVAHGLCCFGVPAYKVKLAGDGMEDGTKMSRKSLARGEEGYGTVRSFVTLALIDGRQEKLKHEKRWWQQ